MAARTPGITERHTRKCGHRDGRCTCTPSYVAWVYDQRTKSKRYKTFSGDGAKSAAKGWRSDAASAVRKGTMPTPSRLTVEEEALAWIERAERGEARGRGGRPLKPSVVRGYVSDLRRYVIPAIGSVRVSQLHRRDVQTRIVDDMVGRGLSGSRVFGVLNAVRVVLRRPLAHDELAADPTTRLDLPAGSEARTRAASPTEAAQLIEALPESERALWATAFYAGLRRGELRGLRCSDLDEKLTEIHVQRGWDDYDGEIEPKSRKGNRRVPIAGVLRLVLLEHLARSGRRGDDLVFGRTATEPFTPTHVRKQALDAWMKQPDLVPIGLHEARHTFVSLMHAAGRSLEEIGDYVGHNSAYMTDRYRHLIDGARAEAAAALDDYLAARTGANTGTQTLRAVEKAGG